MKRLLTALLAFSMLLSLAACGGGDNTGGKNPPPSTGAPATEAPVETAAPVSNEPTYGGEASIYYQNFNTVFDPAMSEFSTYSLWLECLWAPDWGMNDPEQFNFDANVMPLESMSGQIADSWNWVRNGDGTSDLTVTIRNDIYFQAKDAEYDVFGGRNLTAEDVAYSYDRIWGTGICAGQEPVFFDHSWVNMFNGIIDFSREAPVEVTGDYELVFHLATEAESQLGMFMGTRVNITGVEWGDLTPEQQNDWHYACGTGPYILSDYEPDSYYKFTKNENYYDYDERYPENKLPYLDGITLTAVKDAASIMASFIAGDLDFISMDARLTPDQTQQVVDALDGKLHVMNYDSNAAGISLKVNQEPFSDPRVRIALQKAINLEEVNAAYYGYDTELNYGGLWINAMSKWSAVDEWPEELREEYTYDPEGAKVLLAEAGYPNGFTFTVVLDANAEQDLYQLVKSYFAAIGVTMEIEIASDMQAVHQIQGDRNDPRQFNQNVADLEAIDAAMFMYSTTGFAYSNFHEDENFDAILNNARAALTNEEAGTYAKEADLYFAQQHWVIACSGTTVKTELLSERIGGLENGERLSYRCFTKTFLARIWANDTV